MNKLKEKYSSFEMYTHETFDYSENEFDRYVGFFIDKDKDEIGYIITIDLDEIDLEDFKKETKCDITVKQKASLTNELVFKIFDKKIKDEFEKTKEVVYVYYHNSENFDWEEYDESDDDFIK